jgi:hypothetical protein
LRAARVRLPIEHAVRALVVIVVDRREQVCGALPVERVGRLLAVDRGARQVPSAHHDATLLPRIVYTVGSPTYTSRWRCCAARVRDQLCHRRVAIGVLGPEDR